MKPFEINLALAKLEGHKPISDGITHDLIPCGPTLTGLTRIPYYCGSLDLMATLLRRHLRTEEEGEAFFDKLDIEAGGELRLSGMLDGSSYALALICGKPIHLALALLHAKAVCK